MVCVWGGLFDREYKTEGLFSETVDNIEGKETPTEPDSNPDLHHGD